MRGNHGGVDRFRVMGLPAPGAAYGVLPGRRPGTCRRPDSRDAVGEGADFSSTIPGSWIIGALLAWSAHFRMWGGFGAGLVLAVADIAQRQHLGASDYGNAFLLILSGTIVGYLCGSLQQMAAERDAAERATAAAAERARLARAVHDGVLQVLALVQRRGRELGGESERLGELAGEQERVLRRLIRMQSSSVIAADTVDLTSALTQLESIPGVTVSTPGVAIELSPHTAGELVAVVRACLDNVKVHVGGDAPAWVLVQAGPQRVEVSVRDEGPGIPSGRIETAIAQGRLGIAESIRGRVAALGGTTELLTGSSGTEWEIVIPRDGSPPIAGWSTCLRPRKPSESWSSMTTPFGAKPLSATWPKQVTTWLQWQATAVRPWRGSRPRDQIWWFSTCTFRRREASSSSASSCARIRRSAYSCCRHRVNRPTCWRPSRRVPPDTS